MKPFWKSRTLWANVLSLIALAINHDVGHQIPPDIAAAALAVLNVALRLMTTQGVSLAQ